MALLTTIPANEITPIMVIITTNSILKAISPSNTPIKLNTTANEIIIGVEVELNWPTTIRKIKNTAINFAGRHPKIINAMVSAGINIELKRTPGLITGWYSEGWRERWSTTSAILQYANSQVFEKKSFAILYMPSPLQVEPSMLPIMSDYVTVDQRYADFVQDIDRPRNTLRDFCMSNGISFIDMTPVLREAAQTNPVYFLTEGHLNTEGSKLVSKVIYQYIHENIEKVRHADLPAQGKIDIRLTKP